MDAVKKAEKAKNLGKDQVRREQSMLVDFRRSL